MIISQMREVMHWTTRSNVQVVYCVYVRMYYNEMFNNIVLLLDTTEKMTLDCTELYPKHVMYLICVIEILNQTS